MTTVIVVVVVALVFFVTLCTVTFMVWKREEEMRTDSLRSIESNLQELGYRLSDDFGRGSASLNAPAGGISARELHRKGKAYTADPFDWVRNQDADDSNERSVFSSSDREPETADVNGVVSEVLAADEQNGRDEQSVNALSEAAVTAVGDMADNESADTDFEEADVVRVTDCRETDALLDELQDADYREHHSPSEYELPETETAGISLDDIFPDDTDVREEDDIDDIIDIDDLAMLEDIDEYVNDYAAEAMSEPDNSVWYDIGQSGRKYTAEELDMLIKD